MKISYRNTALGLIDNPKSFTFGFPDPDITPTLSPQELKAFGYSLIDSSEQLRILVGDNVQYVSHSFMEAFHAGKSKLAAVFDKEEITEGGVIITGGVTNGFTHWHTYYYFVETTIENGTWNFNVLFIDFSKHAKADECALDIYISRKVYNADVLDKKLIWNGYLKDGRDENYWSGWIIAFVLFKKYCELETKIIAPKSANKHIGTKYVNETDKRIKVLDSTWFTTIVRSEGFHVRGHFRMQPYGPDLSQRKLIWIADFDKEGYTRKAKILNQQTG
jgi:hypothetical protein